MNWGTVANFSLVFLGGAIFLGFLFVCLRNVHAADVRAVFYFYSLATVVSLLAFGWAVHAGAVSRGPVFSDSEVGRLIKLVQGWFTDVDVDLTLVGVAASVLVVPQLLTYLLCAPFGCASGIWFVGWGFNILVWGFVKCFVVIAGILTAWCVSDLYFGAPGDALDALKAIVILMLASGILLSGYRCTPMFLSWLATVAGEDVMKQLRRFHRWACRNQNYAG
jgi:hypothetical protein